MRLLSPLLRQVVYPALGSAGYFRAGNSPLPAVVTYHGVVPDSCRVDDKVPAGPLLKTTNFRNQVRALKKHYTVISPKQFLAWLKDSEALPPRAVLLTCDDGLLNQRTEMLPILVEEKVSCLFFIPASCVEENPEMLWYVELYLVLSGSQNSRFRFQFGDASWDEPLGDLSQRRALWLELLHRLSQLSAGDRALWLRQAEVELGMEQMNRQLLDDPVTRMPFALMTRAEVRGLLEAGMSVGAHTVSHPVLSKQSAGLAEYEISESRRVLEESLRIPIWSMAYPFGDPGSATQREFDLAKRAGYECAFRNCGGPVMASSSWFALPRIHVTAEMRLSELEAHVSGFHSRISDSVRAM